MTPFMFGPLEHITLLGASSLFKPLTTWGEAQGICFTIITHPDQAESISSLNPTICTNLNQLPRPKRCGLAMSFGARWIMKEQTRKALFYNNIVNVHGTRLPFDRGGGNWSYRVMRRDRLGCLMLHQIDDGIDTGPTLAMQEYVIPRYCQTPNDIHHDYLTRLLPFLKAFLAQGIGQTASVERKPQPTHLGSYYPRLSTSVHAHINWQMDPHELEKFILAFDEPYTGAMAKWNGHNVYLKGCQLSAGDTRTADWQAGTVIRKGASFYVIALRNGWSLIVETIIDTQGIPVLPKEGDNLTGEERIVIPSYP